MRSIHVFGRRLAVRMTAAVALLGFQASLWAQSDAIERSSVIPIGRSAPPVDGEGIFANLIKPGDSSRKQREEAISQLPLDRLSRESQQDVRQILKSLSLFRRLPTLEIDADRRVYEFFTDHPDVAVSIWRTMEISQVQMWQTGPVEFETDTRDGTSGTVRVLLRSPDSCLVLCRGLLQSPVLPKPIRADALMHLQPRFCSNGKVQHTLDLYVSFPSVTVETIAKLVSPVSNRIADRNFEEVSLFVELMTRAMSRQPGWIEQLAGRLDGVLAGRPQELLKLTAAVYVDAEKKRLAEQGRPISLEAILPPVSETHTRQ